MYLNRYFDEKRIEFIELHSNILSKKYKKSTKIVIDLNYTIDKFLENNRYIKLTYIDEIIQVVDTYGMFVDESKIIEDTKAVPNRYTLENIYTDNIEKIRSLNRIKVSNIDILLSKKEIMKRKHKIPYSVYYMSRNLEHVLHDRIDNISDEVKEKLSYLFANKYNNVLDFVKFIKESTFSVTSEKKRKLGFLKKETNSLKRYSNLCQIL